MIWIEHIFAAIGVFAVIVLFGVIWNGRSENRGCDADGP